MLRFNRILLCNTRIRYYHHNYEKKNIVIENEKLNKIKKDIEENEKLNKIKKDIEEINNNLNDISKTLQTINDTILYGLFTIALASIIK